MAESGWQSASKFVGFSLAGFGAVILLGALLVTMLILSLIPIYTSDISVAGFGEVYTIPGFTIKAIYTNVTFNFTGGSVLSVAGLSALCTSILRAKQIPNFYACVASNFSAYGPTSNLDRFSVLQRRSIDDVALYEVGDIRLLFSNTCSNRRAIGQWSQYLTHTRNSSCYAQRVAACRSFITTPNTGAFSNQWLPIPVGYTQLVVANITGPGCAALSISNIFNVAYYNYASVYNRYNVTRPWINSGDCYLESIVPQSYLQGLVNNQTTSFNTSVCAATTG